METPYSNPRIPNTRNLESDTITFPDGSEFTSATKIQDDTTSVSVDGDVPTVNFTIGGGLSGQFLSNRLQVPEIRAPNSNGLKLYNDAGNKGIFISDDGYIGIGTTTPYSPFTNMRRGGAIQGNQAESPEGVDFSDFGGVYNYHTKFRFAYTISSAHKDQDQNATWGGVTENDNNDFGVGMYSRYSIWSGYYFVSGVGNLISSDKRIKTNVKDVDDGEALIMLNKLKPRKYEYIDKSIKNCEVMGFIADEVEEVLPHAVERTTNDIPNIYKIVDLSNGYLQFDNSYNVSDISTNNQILLINDADEETHVNITEIDTSLNRIKVDGDPDEILKDASGSNILLYGERVHNYKVLSYESIYTITTAAVQELHKLHREQQEKIEELETRLSALENNS